MKTKFVVLLSTLATAVLLLIAVFTFLAAFSLTAGLTLAASPDAPGPASVATTVELPPPGPSNVTLTRSPTSVPADGTSTSTITVTVKDELGNDVPDGTVVAFTTDLETFPGGSVTLSSSGVYTAEAESSEVTTVGTWHTYTETACNASNGQVIYSGVTNDKVSYTFTGTQVIVLYQKQWNTGFMDVLVDGSLRQQVDTYCCVSPNKQCQQAVVVSNLPYGPHTVEAVVVGTRNPSSSGNSIVVDAFVVSSDCGDAYEPDNSSDDAIIVTPPGTTHHSFHDEGDRDWVRFWGYEGITYTIETRNLTVSGIQRVDTKLVLYRLDVSGLVWLDEDDNDGDEPSASKIEWPITTTGWYYVNAGRFTGSSSYWGCDAYYDLRILGPPAHVQLPIILKNYPPGPPCCPMMEATVGVDDMPRGIAIITATNRIYVANYDDDSISVIDGGTNAVVDTIHLAGYGSGPGGIAYHPSGLLYVSLADSAKVAIITASTGAVMGTVDVGDSPAGVAVNPVTGRVYVANFGSDTVSVISGDIVTGTVSVEDEPSQIAVNPLTNRIFVTNHGADYVEGSSVSVIDGSTDNVIKTIKLVTGLPPTPGQGPHGIAVNPSTNKIYVAVIDSHQLVVIDGNDLDAPPTYIAPPLDVPIWMVAVNPDLNRVYAIGCDEVTLHKVFVLDGATNTWLPCDLDVGTHPRQGVAFNPETGWLYVSNEGSDDVSVIWTCSASEPPPRPPPPPPPPGPGDCYPWVVTPITVGNDPRGVASNDDDNLIYVANNGDGTVSVINGVTYDVIQVIAGVVGANGVAYDGTHNLVYVTMHDSAQLAVIDASTNTVSETVSVGHGPNGVAYNPNADKIYVANYISDTVTILDGGTRALITTLTVPGQTEPAHIAVNPLTNKAYVTYHGSGKVGVIDGNTNAVSIIDIYSAGPYGIAVDTVRSLIYVATLDSHRIVAIGEKDGLPDQYLGWAEFHKDQDPPQPAPMRVIAVNPDLGSTGHLYATTTAEDGGFDRFFAIPKGWQGDPFPPFERPYAIDVGNNPREGIAVNLLNDRVYVTARGSDRLTILQDGLPPCLWNFALDFTVTVCRVGIDGDCR